MTHVTGTYRSDDLEIVFSGTESRGDDPSWSAVTDIEVESVELCGVDILQSLSGVAIMALKDKADGVEWK